MEIEEGWEFIPDTNSKSFLDYGHAGTANNLLLKELIVDMNYFICPPLAEETEETEEEEQDRERKQPASSERALFSPDLACYDESEDRFFKDIGVVLPPPVVLVSPQPDGVAQFFFKKLSADIDMKVADSSPRSPAGWGAAIAVQFDGDDEEAPAEDQPLPEEEEDAEAEDAIRQKNACGFAAWRWRLAGIGAFCSMGAAAAAATFCILVSSGGRLQQRRRIQFSICAEEKSLKVVAQQATRLNQALLAVSGAAALASPPIAMADISFGGHYASA